MNQSEQRASPDSFFRRWYFEFFVSDVVNYLVACSDFIFIPYNLANFNKVTYTNGGKQTERKYSLVGAND